MESMESQLAKALSHARSLEQAALAMEVRVRRISEQLGDLQEAYDKLAVAYQAVLQSRSWRLTAPGRASGQFARRSVKELCRGFARLGWKPKSQLAVASILLPERAVRRLTPCLLQLEGTGYRDVGEFGAGSGTSARIFLRPSAAALQYWRERVRASKLKTR